MTQLILHTLLTADDIATFRVGDYTTIGWPNGRRVVLRVVAIRDGKPEWQPATFWERLHARWCSLRGRVGVQR